MAKKEKYIYKGVCLPLVFIAITLTCIGLVMVFSASYNSNILSTNKDTTIFDDIKFQGIVAIVGIICMFIISRIDYHSLIRPRILISGFVLCVVMLLSVFAFPAVYDSHRWIKLSSFTFQPSEIAKFMAIIYVAYYASRKKWWYRSLNGWLGLLIPVGVLAGLIIIEPDLSTTMTLLGAVVIVMFVSGMQWKFLVGGIAGIGALIPIMISITGYQGRRFESWLNAWGDPKDAGYQVVQSLYAIGDGGLFGVGLGNSKQKITHLPMSDTDYIFSIICEEFGFVGGALVVALYFAYAYFGIKIAMEAEDTFGAYLAAGVTSLIVLQAFINMGVATNVLPSTGITLPFISRGATSLGIVLCATGLLLSVSAHKKRKPKQSND